MNTTNYHVLALIALILWMVGLGVWAERNRFGGSIELAEDNRELLEQNAELTMTVDYLVEENARLRGETFTRQSAAMRGHPPTPPAARDRLQLVVGGNQ